MPFCRQGVQLILDIVPIVNTEKGDDPIGVLLSFPDIGALGGFGGVFRDPGALGGKNLHLRSLQRCFTFLM